MSVEVRPYGVLCNLKCEYCYQNPQRDANNVTKDYDLDAMKAAVALAGTEFIVFGGEPLMAGEPLLREIFGWGYEQFGRNGLQTNASLLRESHIDMFRKYNVQVGVSLDGPDELNDARSAGTLEQTRRATRRSHEALRKLIEAGMTPGLIVTLHRGNAIGDRLPRLVAWLKELDGLVSGVRLHLLEVESDEVRDRWALTTEQATQALLALREAERTLKCIRFDIFRDMSDLLRGDDSSASCVWRACDPYSTPAVHGVEGLGHLSNCGRTNKEGIDFLKCESTGFERYIALYQTPQSEGGCQGCRFFLMCKGNCPGTALHNDWRQRTEHCETYKSLFRQMEDEMLDAGSIPLSASAIRPQVEELQIASWLRGEDQSLRSLVVDAERVAVITDAAAQVHRAPKTLVDSAEYRDESHGDHAEHGDHTDGGQQWKGKAGPQGESDDDHGDHADGEY